MVTVLKITVVNGYNHNKINLNVKLTQESLDLCGLERLSHNYLQWELQQLIFSAFIFISFFFIDMPFLFAEVQL